MTYLTAMVAAVVLVEFFLRLPLRRDWARASSQAMDFIRQFKTLTSDDARQAILIRTGTVLLRQSLIFLIYLLFAISTLFF